MTPSPTPIESVGPIVINSIKAVGTVNPLYMWAGLAILLILTLIVVKKWGK